MNTTLKRGLQILGTVAILGTSACVVDPYYSGVGYGSYDGYDYDNSYTSTTRVIGNGSNFAFNTGFLVGNYYYYDDNYYPSIITLQAAHAITALFSTALITSIPIPAIATSIAIS